jgi:hypothetical protein
MTTEELDSPVSLFLRDWAAKPIQFRSSNIYWHRKSGSSSVKVPDPFFYLITICQSEHMTQNHVIALLCFAAINETESNLTLYSFRPRSGRGG